jgi:hypothetical protein
VQYQSALTKDKYNILTSGEFEGMKASPITMDCESSGRAVLDGRLIYLQTCPMAAVVGGTVVDCTTYWQLLASAHSKNIESLSTTATFKLSTELSLGKKSGHLRDNGVRASAEW